MFTLGDSLNQFTRGLNPVRAAIMSGVEPETAKSGRFQTDRLAFLRSL